MALSAGVVADDLTGACDLAGTAVRAGVPARLHVGVPSEGPCGGDGAVHVVALKSRTAPVRDAVAASLAALERLRRGGAERIYFKYCSTFDSTSAGNIGPVAEALADAVLETTVVACPAFPRNGRTVYVGHLFVDGRLLGESPMADHPLTPMRDADLVRVLGAQASRPVGLVPYDVVVQGASAVAARLERLESSGHGHAVCDALGDRHLATVADAVAGRALLGGGSALAGELCRRWQRSGVLAGPAAPARWPDPDPAGIVAGSCSAATRRQLATAAGEGVQVLPVDPVALAVDDGAVDRLAAQAASAVVDGALVAVASTAEPAAVSEAQNALGRERAASLVEDALAAAARAMVTAGVRRLVVAGGETAGAVAAGLELGGLDVGCEIAPGVPWTFAGDGLAVAFKSGNFGGERFFLDALSAEPPTR